MRCIWRGHDVAQRHVMLPRSGERWASLPSAVDPGEAGAHRARSARDLSSRRARDEEQVPRTPRRSAPVGMTVHREIHPLPPQPPGAAAVRGRRDRAAWHDGAALVPRLGPVQGHRAGLHPEELARGADRLVLPGNVRADLPHRPVRHRADRPVRCARGLHPEPHEEPVARHLPAGDPGTAADLGRGAHPGLGAAVRRQSAASSTRR